MPRKLPRPLAVLLCLFAVAIPAAAQELTEKQIRMFAALPPVDRVLAELPKYDSQFATAVERYVVLKNFSEMGFLIARNGPPRGTKTRVDEYNEVERAEIERIAASLGLPRSPYGIYPQASIRITETWERLHGDEFASRKFIRGLFEKTLDGELREHALNWQDNRFRMHDAPQFVRDALAYVKDLPEPWRGIVLKIQGIPNYVWIALCLVWLVLGLATRTGPFRLQPEKIWILQRARKLLEMNFEHVFVTNIKEREQISVHVNVNQNPHGIQYGGNARVTSKVTATLFVSDVHGRASSFDLVDQRFDVAPGHRLLLVTDVRTGNILFLYNHDMREYLRLDELKYFVKMRPWLLIPFSALAFFGAMSIEASQEVKAAIIVCTPLAYLVWIKLLNLTRRETFMKKFAPRLVEAAGAPPESNFIGTPEHGLRRA
jgi:hypothetical protein